MTSPTVPETKWCAGCASTQPLEAFAYKNKATGRRHARCRNCTRRASHDHHARTKQTNNPGIKLRKQKTAAENRRRVSDRLAAIGCSDCGATGAATLRVVPATGEKELGLRVSEGTSWAVLDAAIARGEVFCMPHHPAYRSTKRKAR